MEESYVKYINKNVNDEGNVLDYNNLYIYGNGLDRELITTKLSTSTSTSTSVARAPDSHITTTQHKDYI